MSNTLRHMLVSPFGMGYKRFGGMVPSASGLGGLFGTIGGWPTAGAFSNVHDTTEGYVDRYSSSTAGDTIGYLSNATMQLMARRAWNTTLTVRAKTSTTSGRLYIGFSSNNTLPISDTVLADSEQGIIVGFSTLTDNFTVFHNDGSGAMVSTASDLPKDTNWHTYDILMASNSNIICMIDSAHTVTISSRYPANDTILYCNAVMQLAASSPTSIDIKGIEFVSDK